MLDILGAMALTAIAVLSSGTLTLGAPNGERRTSWASSSGGRLAVLAAAWFAGIASLAALGVFSRPGGRGTVAIGIAVAAPVVAGLITLARSQTWRAFALGIPLALLVAANAGRVLGAFFVALHAAGRLPPTFALTAGWGDIFVGATAVPLVWAIHRRVPGWRSLTLAWNTIALFDLITAVSLGVGSAQDSPVRFIFESPSSSAIASLPWVMIPGFLVPMYMLTHIAIFARLAVSATNQSRSSMRPAA